MHVDQKRCPMLGSKWPSGEDGGAVFLGNSRLLDALRWRSGVGGGAVVLGIAIADCRTYKGLLKVRKTEI